MHRAIVVFIVFHLVAILLWVLPTRASGIVMARQLIRPYMIWSGMFQSWDTFGPNPKAVDAYIKGVVFTDHRHLHGFQFPRMEQLSYRERYQKERYRKFSENILSTANAGIWPDVGNHMARLFDTPTDHPDRVMLIRFQADIKPGSDDSDPVHKPTVFYEDYVLPGDLQ